MRQLITHSLIIHCPERDVQKLNLKKRIVLQEAIEGNLNLTVAKRGLYHSDVWIRRQVRHKRRNKLQACLPGAEILQNLSRTQQLRDCGWSL